MTELVLISGADEAALLVEAKRLLAFIDRVPDVPLVDVAYTCALNRGPRVLAIIAATTADLRARLASSITRLGGGTLRRIRDKSGTYWFREPLLGEGIGKLAFVYSGVAGFYPDMLRDLAVLYPECREPFDELEEALAHETTFSPSSFIFPPAPCYRHDADIFRSGAYAQALVATYAASAALTRFLKGVGINPMGVVGFAGGDLAAMMRSGAAGEDPPRAARLQAIADIYHVVNKTVNHGGLPTVAMVSILMRHPGDADAVVASFPPDKVTLTVDLSPRQRTYAISADFEETALAAFAAADIRTAKLALDLPFNTSACKDMVAAIRKFAKGWMKKDPIYDVYSCATAARLPSSVRRAREDTAARWEQTVRFRETIDQMYADGYRVFLEVGPRGALMRSVEDILAGKEFAAIASNAMHRTGRLQLMHAIGHLAALGLNVDVAHYFQRRKAHVLDFDATISLEVRKFAEKPLSRVFPRLTILSLGDMVAQAKARAVPQGRGARAATRAASASQKTRRQQQFDFGAVNPLVSDADILASDPGMTLEIVKEFRLTDMPFLGDYALGTGQLSYSDPNLKGLVLLTLPVGAEIMAEVAQRVVAGRQLVALENLNGWRNVPFHRGVLKLFVRAERVSSGDPQMTAVKVQIRDDSPNAAYTRPVMETTVLFADVARPRQPASPVALAKPRTVHWSRRDIYPSRIPNGSRLRGIRFAETWSESGLDYEVAVPSWAGNVTFTRFPVWAIDPLLFQVIVSGFSLWRSHEKFAGAFSFPFRLRRLDFFGTLPDEGQSLRCYMRLMGVTPRSHISDIDVTDGNGNVVMRFSGWEEITERVPSEYRDLVLQPANTFLTRRLSPDMLGDPATEVASAFVTEVPYPLFERNEELWLKMLSHVVLATSERKDFAEMTGSTSRRTEWLFGRVVAKEAVRRFMKDYYQARWSDADVKIWADDFGKPHALGEWSDYLTSHVDIAIAHTAQFIVAIAAANARVGIDVESFTRDISEEFSQGVFSPDELELAAQSARSAQVLVRFWCAKEAVSKALGTGIRYAPREMVVTDYQADSGRIVIRLTGGWVEAFKDFRGRDIEVSVRTVRDHALASCFIPATLFHDED